MSTMHFGTTLDDVISNMSENKCMVCHNKDFSTLSSKDFKAHLKKHWVQSVSHSIGERKGYVFPCRKLCPGITSKSLKERQRSHYHCPHLQCQKMFGRKQSFKEHLKKCSIAKEKSGIKNIEADMNKHVHLITENEQKSKSTGKVHGKLKCVHCNNQFQSLYALRRHGELEHNIKQSTLPCVTIDPKQGLYMVAGKRGGELAPIHVQKHNMLCMSSCTDDNCAHLMKAVATTNPGRDCPHLEAVKNAFIQKKRVLDTSYLISMEELGIVSKYSLEEIEKKHAESLEKETPLVVKADFYSLGFSNRYLYYSVHCDKEEYYCKLQRLRVTFDTETGVWSCECPTSSSTNICQHELIAKWHVFQFDPTLLNSSRTKRSPTELENKQIQYLLTKKLIPEKLEEQYLTEVVPPNLLLPKETQCPSCEENLDVAEQLKGSIYGMNKVWKGILIVEKKCESCGFTVRFQEYESGLHNYNNTVILTLRLCHQILKGIQHHVDVESSIKIIFDESGSLPINDLRNGFYHFCAMQNREYDFTCVKCGYNPRIIIGDGNWANCCRRPVEALQPEETNQDIVDCEEIWLEYKKEIVGRGFYGSVHNPWKVSLNYSLLSGWIGKHTRNLSGVHSTEQNKCNILQKAKSQKPSRVTNISQDEILDALHKKDKTSLQDLCDEIGISSKGPTEDLVNALNEMVLFKDIYPKFFKRIKKCGGGVLHFRCPHGICYYLKTLLRHESARDHVDGLLSFQKQPVVFISDIASQVAHHGENRRPGMFSPNMGMLYEWNEQNITKFANNELIKCQVNLEDTEKHFSLFDKFHMRSKKKSAERSFRSLVNSDLGWINSSAAEQSNSQMAKDRHFLYSMNFVNYMFFSRLSAHLGNTKINNRYAKKAKQLFDVTMETDKHGVGLPVLQNRQLLANTSSSDTDDFEIPKVKPRRNLSKRIGVSQKNDANTAKMRRIASNKTTENTAKKAVVESGFMGSKNLVTKANDVADLLHVPSNHLVVSCFQSYSIRHSSFVTLRDEQWLDGEIIDFYLRSLTINLPAVHILDCFLVTAILDNKHHIYKRHSQNKVTFSDYNQILGAFNKNKNHWNLLHVNLETEKVILIDPFGSSELQSTDAAKKLSGYLSSRQNPKDDHLKKVVWKPSTIDHPIQKDASSCGVLVLKTAEMILKKETTFDASAAAVRGHRTQIGQTILDVSEPRSNFCCVCGKLNCGKAKTDWICCDKCERWFHRDCINLSKQQFKKASKQKWYCQFCK